MKRRLVVSLVFSLAVAYECGIASTVLAAGDNGRVDAVYDSEQTVDKFSLSFEWTNASKIGGKKIKPVTDHPAPSAPRPKPRHQKVAVTRLPRNIQCLNQLTAYGRKNYVDRITAGLERRSAGNTPVSEQIRRLTSTQRVAYKNCIKPWPKLKRKAPRAHSGKSLVELLAEQKDFTVPSAGLQIQPDGRHIPSKPAIIYATDAAPRTQDFVLGGRNLTIRFTPVKYVADLGDGGPILEQAETPMPYPDAFKGHFYRKFTRSGTFTVTMETYWRVEWFNPAAGTWVTEAEPLIGTEQTNPQVVMPYKYVLSDDAEERHGR